MQKEVAFDAVAFRMSQGKFTSSDVDFTALDRASSPPADFEEDSHMAGRDAQKAEAAAIVDIAAAHDAARSANYAAASGEAVFDARRSVAE